MENILSLVLGEIYFVVMRFVERYGWFLLVFGKFFISARNGAAGRPSRLKRLPRGTGAQL
jgi:hypothetical protein